MNRTGWMRRLALLSAALGATLSAACGGARGASSAAPTPATHDSTALSLSPSSPGVDSLGAVVARAEQDSAADQQLLDSLHGPHPRADSLGGRPPAASSIKGEDVEREAERLFGAEGRAVIGAAPSPEPTFDIDVSSFSTNRRVLEYLEFFQVDSRDRFEIWLARLGRYQGMIRERLRAKRLPEDLLYLCLIESGFSNTAVSRAKAVGMWQFMASTARLYGLTVDPWVDERRDPFRATEAAVNYLADLRERLGSVYLAAAAYNAGVGRVERVARLADTAVAVLLELNPQYVRGVTPPGRSVVVRVPRGRGTLVAERYDSLPVTERITFVDHYVSRGQTLSDIAKRYRVSVTMIESANPRIKAHALRVGQRLIIPMSGRVVPASAWSVPPESRYRRVSSTGVSAGNHRVQSGETASEIARRYRVSLTALLNYNGLTMGSVLRAGDVLKIPQKQ